MLDPKLIRHNLPALAEKLASRGTILPITELENLEKSRKQLQQTVQDLQHKRNHYSKAIGLAKRNNENTDPLMAEMQIIGDALSEKNKNLDEIQEKLNALLAEIPNIPHTSTPIGKSEKDNVEIRRWGTPPQFDFTPKDHVSLGEQLNSMDFERAAAIAGSRFVVLKGCLARLQRALTQFMLDIHSKEHGYEEVYVPYIANEKALFGTTQLPKFAEEQFALKTSPPFYLIPTAEVSVTNLVRDSILPAACLPLKRVAHTPCFRSEAGSYGKDTRGMIRQHQFEKVELVWVASPETSYDCLEQLTAHAERILQLLNLPYRVIALCTGDLGFQSAKTYDIEVWLPSQQQYREISSCSNCESFQARRLQARYKDPARKNEVAYVHTLNGSGLAVGRTLVAILENFQLADGRIRIPEILQPYLNDQKYLTPGDNQLEYGS